MSTTLTNGLKLPDKGSVDWYADMQNNYQILDGAVGTVAEHTSALAGKAPLVHTHTKSDITDFPAYGTTAGTICEGNDSRLSDARTPVAHTHLTADVTDLLNSAHTWTASQTLASNSFLTTYGYRFRIKNDSMVLGTVPSSNQWTGMQFVDKNDTPISEIVQSLQSNGNSLYQINVFPNEANSQKRSLLAYTYSSTNNNNGVAFSSNVVPQNTNTYDLGFSSYQWNNLYAKKVNTQSVNGINPGALSLPSKVYTGAIAITEIDRTGWVYDGTVNTYSPPVDCWLSISNGGSITVWGSNTAFGMKATDNIAIPLRQGETYNVSLTHTPDFCRIYPCTGNV